MFDIAYSVLFVDSFNSTTSIFGERLLHSMSRGRFKAFSAGSHPARDVHPLTLRTLRTLCMPTQDLTCKGLQSFVGKEALEMDFVFIVGDLRLADGPPLWPGQPMVADWRMPDPASMGSNEQDAQSAFISAAVALKRRIELMLALPPSRLEAMTGRTDFMDVGDR